MCGSSDSQNQIESQQQGFFGTMQNEAQSVFGQNSALYGQLLKAFEPILQAGPGQEGFSGAEKSAFNSQATEEVAGNYAKAARAVGEQSAGAGGGNEYIPSGQAESERGQIASAAAGEESDLQEKITQADYEQGNQNYRSAVSGLMGAGEVFSPSEQMFGQTTNAGTAAANTANQIAQQDNAWMGAVGGMLGSAVGGWATGGFKLPH